MSRRAFEDQMFEQMRHPGFAVIFVARADQIGDVDGDRLLGRIGEEQYAKAVRQTVFGDALDRSDTLRILRRDERDRNDERQREARQSEQLGNAFAFGHD
ncbi:MAG: hypothetical protein JMDDDDMK_03484 [Acidobacteria bacterium]|nr:hypothetical protein [Acidobacteriota bacterium]